MAIREGAWDCPHCGREGNRGPAKYCAGCGAPRGPEVRFYLPGDAPEVTDPEALARARSGPDWSCTYCGGDNPAGDGFCSGCGASREGAPPRPVIEIREPVFPAGAVPSPPAALPPPFEKAAAMPGGEDRGGGRAGEADRPDTTGKTEKKRGCLPCGASCSSLGCLAVLVFLLFGIVGSWFSPSPSPSPGTSERPPGLLERAPAPPRAAAAPSERPAAGGVVTVVGHRWTRSIEVEERVVETREGWEDEVPSGARILGSSIEVYDTRRVQVDTETRVHTTTERIQVGTERVKVGVRDLGNGYFEDIYEERPVFEDVERRETREEPVYREEPIYRERVRYEAERWRTARREKASGEDPRSVAWPRVRLGPGEREGSRRESYEVILRDEKGRERVYGVSTESGWRSYQTGRRYRAELGWLGGVKDLQGPL